MAGPPHNPDNDKRHGSTDAPVVSGAEVKGGSPAFLPDGKLDIIALAVAIINTVWASVEGIRMRLKIKRDLGRKATDTDLTSIDTWMKVEESERQGERNGPVKPR
jgi:hypothetical protein